MNGRVKTLLLVILLVAVGGIAIYKTHERDAAQKAELIKQEQAQKAKEAAEKPVEKYVAPKQAVVGATTYPDGELINLANENYAQFMGNSNNYNFENVVSKEANGNKLTVTFNATVNGTPQQITMNVEQVDNVITIVK